MTMEIKIAPYNHLGKLGKRQSPNFLAAGTSRIEQCLLGNYSKSWVKWEKANCLTSEWKLEI
jgi:hypothetical protein